MRLYAKSPSAYKAFGEVLALPSPTTLRSERNKFGAVKPGVQQDLIERLAVVASAAEDNEGSHQQMVALVMDEMSIKGKVIFIDFVWL